MREIIFGKLNFGIFLLLGALISEAWFVETLRPVPTTHHHCKEECVCVCVCVAPLLYSRIWCDCTLHRYIYYVYLYTSTSLVSYTVRLQLYLTNKYFLIC